MWQKIESINDARDESKDDSVAEMAGKAMSLRLLSLLLPLLPLK